jgi:hypothetical protein
LGRIGQGFLHDVRGIDPGLEAAIQMQCDHPAQPLPMADQALLPRRRVTADRSLEQLLGVG